MERRTGSVPKSLKVCLQDYKLAFRQVLNRPEVYATIVPSVGAEVYGVAYWCSPHAMNQLDIFEGVADNCYRRESVKVTATETEEVLECIVYIGVSFSTEDAVPGDIYLDLILTGAAEHQLSFEYIDTIRAIAMR